MLFFGLNFVVVIDEILNIIWFIVMNCGFVEGVVFLIVLNG